MSEEAKFVIRLLLLQIVSGLIGILVMCALIRNGILP